jgi:hypothetical protein
MQMAVPGVAIATSHSSSSLRSKAEKVCRAELKKEGAKKFEAKFKSKTAKAAMGKCVSAYEKAHKKG